MDKLIALAFFGAVALHGAWGGVGDLADAVTQPWPTELSCAELAAGGAEAGDWVRLWNCEANLNAAQLPLVLMRGERLRMTVPLHARGDRNATPVVRMSTAGWIDAVAASREDLRRDARLAADAYLGDPIDAAELEAANVDLAERRAVADRMQSALSMGVEGRLVRSGGLEFVHGDRPAVVEPLLYVLWMLFGVVGFLGTLTGKAVRLRIPRPKGW